MSALPYPLPTKLRQELERQIQKAVGGVRPPGLADQRRDTIRARCHTFAAKNPRRYELLMQAAEQFSKTRWRNLIKEMEQSGLI
jgi:hypothetical protein